MSTIRPSRTVSTCHRLASPPRVLCQRVGHPGWRRHPLGGLGFANWAYEVQAQEQDLGVFFDTIVVCTPSRAAPTPG